jgi:hypothetical protein
MAFAKWPSTVTCHSIDSLNQCRVISRNHKWKVNKMQTRYRVSYTFTTLPDLGLIAFIQAVITCLTGNAAFTSLAALLADLTTALTAFEAAVAAMELNSNTTLTAQRDEARETLLDTARKTGAAVQSIALNSLSTLLSSGFTNVVPPSAQTQLDAPTVLSVANYGTTKVLMRLTPIANAKTYESRLSLDGGVTWVSGGITTQARSIILGSLTPGKVYMIQARAIGGSTGFSDWSTSVTIMAT